MESHKIIQVDEKVPFNLLIPLSIQHMFAMFGASVLVPILFNTWAGKVVVDPALVPLDAVDAPLPACAVATIGVPASRALAHAVALSCGSASMTQTRSPVASAATAV